VFYLLVLVGCGGTQETTSNAGSAVSYWGKDAVWFVADGPLPRELPGWAFASQADGRRERRDVRLTSADTALAMLREWSTEERVCFVVLPLGAGELSEKLQSDPMSSMEQLSWWSALLGEERGAMYLLVISPPEGAAELRSVLAAAGLHDDTERFVESLVRKAEWLADRLEAIFAPKATGNQ
jgi:hypothetical protein